MAWWIITLIISISTALGIGYVLIDTLKVYRIYKKFKSKRRPSRKDILTILVLVLSTLILLSVLTFTSFSFASYFFHIKKDKAKILNCSKNKSRMVLLINSKVVNIAIPSYLTELCEFKDQEVILEYVQILGHKIFGRIEGTTIRYRNIIDTAGLILVIASLILSIIYIIRTLVLRLPSESAKEITQRMYRKKILPSKNIN